MLSPRFKYQFQAPVWRLCLDPVGKRLALEVRNADTLLAYFYTLDLENDKLESIPVMLEKSWWVGMEDAHAGMLLLHGYGDRKLGQHKGVKAYNTASGGLLQWEQSDLTFYGVGADGILAFSTAAPENGFTLLETREGRVLPGTLSQQQASEKVQTYLPERYTACTYPSVYVEGDEYFEDVSQFIKSQEGEKPVKAIEYAEINNFIVISYYLQAFDSKMTNYLAVFDTSGKFLLKECLGAGLTGLGSDTFIIFNQNLYFVQHREILKVYTLF